VVAFLEVRDGKLVLVARAVVTTVGTRVVERNLRLINGAVTAEVGSLPPGTARDFALVVPAVGADLGATFTGEVRLDGDDGSWMLRRFEVTTGMERAVQLLGALPRRGAEQAEGLAAVARRLTNEFESALVEPKLYKRKGDGSELELFGAGLRSLSADDAAPIVEAVARPLLARADARSVPRRVRNAVREALGMRN
jgi:hypothetical protein